MTNEVMSGEKYDRVKRERDELRVECETLKQERDTFVEKVRSYFSSKSGANPLDDLSRLHEKCARLERERDRLRAALDQGGTMSLLRAGGHVTEYGFQKIRALLTPTGDTDQ